MSILKQIETEVLFESENVCFETNRDRSKQSNARAIINQSYPMIYGHK